MHQVRCRPLSVKQAPVFARPWDVQVQEAPEIAAQFARRVVHAQALIGQVLNVLSDNGRCLKGFGPFQYSLHFLGFGYEIVPRRLRPRHLLVDSNLLSGLHGERVSHHIRDRHFVVKERSL